MVCAPNKEYLDNTLEMVTETLQKNGFQLEAEKIQRVSPRKYLGIKITVTTVTPQPLAINNNPKMLFDMQQLCGAVQWIRPCLGLTSEDNAAMLKSVAKKSGT